MNKRILSVFLSFAMVFTVLSVMLPISESQAQALTNNQKNIVKRANYMFNRGKWTCQKLVEGWGGTFYPGQTYNVPYGQPVYSGCYIGFNGDTLDDSCLDRYLAAAADANSVFYSGRSHCGGTTAPYYATDCSAFVSWCWGISRKTTYSLQFEGTNLGLITLDNCKNLEVGDALNSNSAGHVVLVTGLDYDSNGVLTSIEITEQTPPQLKRTKYTPEELSAKYSSEYYLMRWSGDVPSAPATVTLPTGSVDEIEGREGAVYLRGWAFDEDDISANIEVHVYIGGKPGDANAVGFPVIADKERIDVDNVFGCGADHGFEHLIPVALTGVQPVYVYAIDSDYPQTNSLIKSAIVNILPDTEIPKAEGIYIKSSDLNGFEVATNVSDNSGVTKAKFYAWSKEDQSDMKRYDVNVTEDEASCYIPIADFNNFNGKYYVDVYVFDEAGNMGGSGGFTTTFNNPVAHFDEAVGGKGFVKVKGWAYDPDNTDENLEVHVYVGKPVGDPSAELHKFIADVERTDLDNIYHCGVYHGFEINLPTSLVGEQQVYLYAINIGNGGNKFIGQKTVNIEFDPDKPMASDIEVVSSDKNGFTVGCKLDNNVRVSAVKVQTWTAANSDVKKMYDAKIENGTATCTIPIADFDDYEGTYVTHIYVYDDYNNSVVYPFATTFNMPLGSLDEVSNAIGGIRVKGWAFDADRMLESLEIHVYVGGAPGEDGTELYKITADKLRTDVNERFGCGENHGYLDVIKTKLTGEQPVYVYAINKGNGDNKLIGKKTVTIVPTLYGDTDHDGEISIGDVTYIQENLAGIVDFSDKEITLADVNGNGVVDIRDATYIQLYLAKKIEIFPVMSKTLL